MLIKLPSLVAAGNGIRFAGGGRLVRDSGSKGGWPWYFGSWF